MGQDGPDEAGQALALPSGWGARRLGFGSQWNVVNVAILVRQMRRTIDPGHEALTLPRGLAFGLCRGTADPFGSAAPAGFVGVRLAAMMTRGGSGYWWSAGAEALFAWQDGEAALPFLGSAAVLVRPRAQGGGSALYCRIAKRAGGVRIDAFLPDSERGQWRGDLDFVSGLSDWSEFANNHRAHWSQSLNLAVDAATVAALDTFNIVLPAAQHPTTELGPFELVEAKVVRIE